MLYACRIARVASYLRKNTYINCADKESGHQLSKQLWAFSKTAFTPHEYLDMNKNVTKTNYFSADMVVTIGAHGTTPQQCQWLINLASLVPENFMTSDCIIEIISPQDETVLASCREKYRDYKTRNFAPLTKRDVESHKLTDLLPPH